MVAGKHYRERRDKVADTYSNLHEQTPPKVFLQQNEKISVIWILFHILIRSLLILSNFRIAVIIGVVLWAKLKRKWRINNIIIQTKRHGTQNVIFEKGDSRGTRFSASHRERKYIRQNVVIILVWEMILNFQLRRYVDSWVQLVSSCLHTEAKIIYLIKL